MIFFPQRATHAADIREVCGSVLRRQKVLSMELLGPRAFARELGGPGVIFGTRQALAVCFVGDDQQQSVGLGCNPVAADILSHR